MKYVISDLHGIYDKFIEMLELINFSKEDELYILGDIFDRGPNPLAILEYVLAHKNIHLIKGNHEEMFIDYFEDGDGSLWYYNGGQTTHHQIIKMGYIYEESLYKYIKKLPTYMVVDKFILVHAGLYFPSNYNELSLEQLLEQQEEDINLWDRSNVGKDIKFKDYTVICGHTPVQSINDSIDEVKIVHTPGHIYIDCGCCFTKANGKLACLRLDDMEEFYV